MAFDPVEATNAFLATRSQAERLTATHYTQGGHWLLLWSWLITVIAAVVIARWGLLRRLDQRIERRRPRPLLASLILSIAFIAVDDLLETPWTGYRDWWREMNYGLTSQPFAGWLAEHLLAIVLAALLIGLFVSAVYALLRRARRSWWAWTGLLTAFFVLFVMALAPVFIEPLFNRYVSAPAGPTRDAAIALAERAGVPHDKIFIFNGSKQSNRYTANMAGLGGSARVAMSDAMFAKGADLPEVRGVLGHEMGHYKRGHVFVIAAIYGLLAAAVAFVIARVFPAAERLIRSGAKDLADPVGLPVLSILVSTAILLVTPLTNTMTRLYESDADRFSLNVAHEPDGLSKALVKTSEYRADSPSRIEEILFYDHPSVRRRVEGAMRWKAAHMAQTAEQAAEDARIQASLTSITR